MLLECMSPEVHRFDWREMKCPITSFSLQGAAGLWIPPGRVNTVVSQVLRFACFLLEREAMVLAKVEATALIPKV